MIRSRLFKNSNPELTIVNEEFEFLEQRGDKRF